MITLLKEDIGKTKLYFKENGFSFNENSGCLAAKEREEVLGYSLFYLDGEGMTVLKIAAGDLMLFDGILRSTLHIAAERGVMDAFYADTLNTENLEKLGFIKDRCEKRLDIDKLFKSSCCCK